MAATRALEGWRVLVPRSGAWGERVADLVRARGAEPVVAPLIRTEPVASDGLAQALRALEAGDYDWLVVTSAAAVTALAGHHPADSTRVAAVGPATASALAAVGIAVELVPDTDHSARGILASWPRGGGADRALLPQSDLAEATLADGLRALGLVVDAITAYRTLGEPLEPEALAALSGAGRAAALVTSGSAARSLAAQRASLPADLLVACIGSGTAAEARAAGLDVHVVAAERSADALVAALAEASATSSISSAPPSKDSA